jgi:hypothetical protein
MMRNVDARLKLRFAFSRVEKRREERRNARSTSPDFFEEMNRERSSSESLSPYGARNDSC